MVLTRSQAKNTAGGSGPASYPTSTPATPSRPPRPQKVKTTSKSTPHIPNESNITASQTKSALKKKKIDSTPLTKRSKQLQLEELPTTLAIPNDDTSTNRPGPRPLPPCAELSTTTAVARNPPIEEEEEEDDDDDDDDDDGNTPPPTNNFNERVIYPDVWPSRPEESQKREPIRMKNTAARIPREENIPLHQDTRAQLITSSLQDIPNSNIISRSRTSPRPWPGRVERDESDIIAGGRGRGRGGEGGRRRRKEEVEPFPISITRLRNPARTLPRPRPYSPDKLTRGPRLSSSSSGSSPSWTSSERRAVDDKEMSDRERSEGFLDGEDDSSAYSLPVLHSRDGSVIHGIEHDISNTTEQEEERGLIQRLLLNFLETIQVPFIFLYGLFHLAVLEFILRILLLWVILFGIQATWPHGCLTFPSVPYLDTDDTISTIKLCLYPPPLKATVSLSTLSILHQNLTSVTSKLSASPLDEDLPNTLQAITLSVGKVKRTLNILSGVILEELKTAEPVGEEGKSRLRALGMRVSDKVVLEELRKEVQDSEDSSEGARRGLWELKHSVWEDGGRVIGVLDETIWRLADSIKDGKREKVPEPEQNITNLIARWLLRDRRPEIDFLTVQILSLPSAKNFSTTAQFAKGTLNHLSMLDIHLHTIPILVERLKFEVIYSIPGLKRKSRDALHDLEMKIEPFDKFRREVKRRCSGLNEIEKTYRGAGVSVADLQRQAGGGLLKVEELDDRVGDGKLLEVFRGAVKELKEARRRWRKFNKKNEELGEESQDREREQGEGGEGRDGEGCTGGPFDIEEGQKI